MDENPQIQPEEEEPTPPETERLSWSAYFGGAAGLVAGVVMALFLSASLHWWLERKRATEIFWGVVGPLLAFLGVMAGSFLFHRLFRGQVWLPAILFLTVLAAGVFYVFEVVGFPWLTPG
jgi:hypothetical protein